MGYSFLLKSQSLEFAQRRTFGSENYVAISPDSQILVSYGGQIIKLGNLQTGELLHGLQTGIRIASAAAIDPDGKYSHFK